MDDRSRAADEQPQPPPSEHRATIELTYARADDVRRDRLRDVPRGLMARCPAPLHPGDAALVRIDVTRERASASALGVVRWATPLARGSLVGLEIEGVTHRDTVKLDLLLGIRIAGSLDDLAAGEPIEGPPISVTMLQPNGVLRQVIQSALERFASEKAGGAALRLEAAQDVPTFVAAVSARRPDLAIIDCDGIADEADPIVDAVRSHEPSRRTPVILLSSERSPRVEDRYTVTMRKPLAMKAFLTTAGLLLGG